VVGRVDVRDGSGEGRGGGGGSGVVMSGKAGAGKKDGERNLTEGDEETMGWVKRRGGSDGVVG